MSSSTIHGYLRAVLYGPTRALGGECKCQRVPHQGCDRVRARLFSLNLPQSLCWPSTYSPPFSVPALAITLCTLFRRILRPSHTTDASMA
eukprot:5660750-Amphidinium_carterae.2